MRAAQLVVRCYAELEGPQWVAVCVDLSLAAQADSFEEAREKLDAQIREYVFDALAGEDQAHAGILLTRKAPLRFRLKYSIASVRSAWASKFGTTGRSAHPVRFKETLPLVPALC